MIVLLMGMINVMGVILLLRFLNLLLFNLGINEMVRLAFLVERGIFRRMDFIL
mgnify:CR=1 FL=1|jgi:hypothetical protein